VAPTHRREQTSTPTERERGTTSLVNIYRKDTPGQTDDADDDKIDEDLRDWFGKGKSGGVGGGGWDRYNSKGERIGKCGDAEDRGGAGEGKPKCLSKQKAAQLRAKGGKQAIANAVSRKKSQDSVTDRPGTGNAPRPVSNRIGEDVLSEKNVPTNPGLWSRAKSAAKSKFDVYPSAYANGWAAKWYKSKGGGWKTEETENVSEHIVKVDGKYRLVSKTSGKNLGTYDTKAGAEQREREVQYFKQQEDTMSRVPSFKQHIREFSGDTVTEALTQPHGHLHDQVKAAFTKIIPVHQIYAIAAVCEYLASQPLYGRQKAYFLAIAKRLEELHGDVNERANPARDFPHDKAEQAARSQYLVMIQHVTIVKATFAKMAPKDQIDAIVEMCKHLIGTPIYSPEKPDLRDIIGHLEKLHSFVDHLGAGASGGRIH
jgi:hypothetical protein